MGAVRKWTGAQAQIDATRQNADAQEKATKQAAAAQQKALTDAARATADQTAMLASRQAATQQATDAVSKPMETADVQLDEAPGETSAASSRRRRASFGRNYSTGVSV